MGRTEFSEQGLIMDQLFFFLRFINLFCCGPCFKVLIESVTTLLLFWFPGHEACGTLAPKSRMDTSCSGRRSLNHLTTRQVPRPAFHLYFPHFVVLLLQRMELGIFHVVPQLKHLLKPLVTLGVVGSTWIVFSLCQTEISPVALALCIWVYILLFILGP